MNIIQLITKQLEKKEGINHNTSLFRFTLAEKNQVAGLPVASCVMFRFVDKDGKEVIRPYTPTSDEEVSTLFYFLFSSKKCLFIMITFLD
jgi:cytochrome-b5 reductase